MRAAPMPQRLRLLESLAKSVDLDKQALDRQIADAVESGYSLRAVARAAGVSARTVQRIAERDGS